MKTNTKYNLYIVAVWVVFAMITACMGMFLSSAIDNGAVGKSILGVVSYVGLVLGTVKFGKYVNKEREEELTEHLTK